MQKVKMRSEGYQDCVNDRENAEKDDETDADNREEKC
jgi:hypothetical protein